MMTASGFRSLIFGISATPSVSGRRKSRMTRSTSSPQRSSASAPSSASSTRYPAATRRSLSDQRISFSSSTMRIRGGAIAGILDARERNVPEGWKRRADEAEDEIEIERLRHDARRAERERPLGRVRRAVGGHDDDRTG